jgi:aminodeoxyfutalosine synthase
MTTTFDALTARIEAGESLSRTELLELSAAPDILQIGMLADAARRRLRGATVTYLRVARCAFDQSLADAVPPAAREVRLTGAPASLAQAVAAVESARAVAGERAVTGFSWVDLAPLGAMSDVLPALRAAGLDGLAELPLDRLDNAAEAIDRLISAGFQRLRLTIDKAAGDERQALLFTAAELQDRFAAIQALNPLPMTVNSLRPTTGYDDVKSVAVARLAATNIPVIQVDWLRYGPKLAQVALTFGADDLDEVPASDESPDGRRRAPIEEVRRNIEAAGFTPAERDGRFAVVS